MTNQPILVTKGSGEKVPFSEEKLRISLKKAGANEALINQIVEVIERSLYPGIKTKYIYQKAFSFLKKRSRPSAAKYKLKRAIMELGPSGYPFEKYIGEILRFSGYDVQVGVVMQGHCITHEVDVLGEKNNSRIAVECKFGNTNDKKVDVKVALYIHSRFRDLVKEWKKSKELAHKEFQGWIVTNSSFTSDAIQYGTCAGLSLIGWNYPKKGNIKDLIEFSKLYPLTSLTSLKNEEKKFLLKKNIVLSKTLESRKELLHELEISATRIRRILDEVEGLCFESQE